MTNKNYPNIAREILDNNDMEPMNIKVSSKHLKRIENVAEEMDLTVSETCTFLLYSYINDVELHAKLESQKLMN